MARFLDRHQVGAIRRPGRLHIAMAPGVGMSIDSSPPPLRGGAGQPADRPARVVRVLADGLKKVVVPEAALRYEKSCNGGTKLVVARENFVTEVERQGGAVFMGKGVRATSS